MHPFLRAVAIAAACASAIAAAEQQVSRQDGAVQKNDRIDSSAEDIAEPSTLLSLANGRIEIDSKTFTPPEGTTFKPFPEGGFVDISRNEPGTVSVEPVLQNERQISVKGIYVQNTAADFPLRAEGLLQPGGGGAGQAAALEFHWAAKTRKLRLVVMDGAVEIPPPSPLSEAFITADPRMPALNAHLEPLGLTGNVKWTFNVTYAARTRQDNDTYPKPTPPRELPYATRWEIIPDMGGDFRGGHAVVTAEYAGSTLKLEFSIRGRNPTVDIARQYINARNAPPYARAIVSHESAFRQFFAGTTSPGEPLLGPGSANGGWGMCQIDDANALIPAQQLWNWHANVDRGVQIMNEKLAAATAFYNRQIAQQAADAPAKTIDTVGLSYGGLAFLTTTPPHLPVNALGIQYFNGTNPGGAGSHSLFSWDRSAKTWTVYGAPWRTYTDAVATIWRTTEP